MRNLTTELKVGLLILAGISAVVYSSVVVTGWRPGIGDTYTVNVYFDNTSGLLVGSPAQTAGVKIGQVEKIALNGGRAQVTLAIYKTQTLYQDATATIRSLGILGDKYVDVRPGTTLAAPLTNGDTIQLTLPSGDLESLMESVSNILNDFESVSTTLRQTLGDPAGRQRLENIMDQIAATTRDLSRITDATNKQIDAILGNLKGFTGDLERITSENRVAIRELMHNLAAFSADLKNITKDNRDNLDRIIVNLNTFIDALAKDGPSITGDLRQVLAQNKDALNSALRNLDNSFIKLDRTMASLESVSGKLDSGKGSLGKLINDETTIDELNSALTGLNRFLTEADRIKLDMGGEVERLSKQGLYKSYFNIHLQPLKDRYYLMQLVDNPRGTAERKTIVTSIDGGTPSTTQETTTTEKLQLSLIIAQRYFDTVIKGGIMENSFGLGVEQIFGSADQIRIGLDVWDFGNDLGPHVKVAGYWRFFSNAFLVVGGDDLVSKEPTFRDAFFGIGVRFNEDSLKPIFSSLPIGSMSK